MNDDEIYFRKINTEKENIYKKSINANQDDPAILFYKGGQMIFLATRSTEVIMNFKNLKLKDYDFTFTVASRWRYGCNWS